MTSDILTQIDLSVPGAKDLLCQIMLCSDILDIFFLPETLYHQNEATRLRLRVFVMHGELPVNDRSRYIFNHFNGKQVRSWTSSDQSAGFE